VSARLPLTVLGTWCAGWSALLFALAWPAIAPQRAEAGTWSSATPPIRFQGSTAFHVTFVDGGDVNRLWLAGNPAPPAGMEVFAFTTHPAGAPPRVTIGNPCEFPGEVFAHRLCHELAHVNGWSAAHEE
jgi:hypothetical protein